MRLPETALITVGALVSGTRALFCGACCGWVIAEDLEKISSLATPAGHYGADPDEDPVREALAVPTGQMRAQLGAMPRPLPKTSKPPSVRFRRPALGRRCRPSPTMPADPVQHASRSASQG
ncbi:hypothetical protein SAV14893_093480 [Streptomyces avermitilis]|uniref:Uncharacterized protein n=1 Tax=Streptomyces avermitilis TaxID=33903 RepID=A0A4D4MDS4_STRAX|nr:hypothetical protein SAVMC3_02940 [Streptomyces avermitilis]GDY69955.1 hypothetical protein SAV14893_093480 [Streptomyces avermitilis]